jgi:hypothetical protein
MGGLVARDVVERSLVPLWTRPGPVSTTCAVSQLLVREARHLSENCLIRGCHREDAAR